MATIPNPTKIYEPQDHRDNEIINVKTPTPATESNDTTVTNTEFVNLKTILNTAVSTSLINANRENGAVPVGTPVHDKTVLELLELLFFELIPAEYILPTTTLTIQNISTLSREVGKLQTVRLELTFTANDSDGIETDGIIYSGTGLSVPVNSNSLILDIPITTQLYNIWYSETTYQGSSVIKNDSYGNPDPSGQFGSGVLNNSVSMAAYWPWYWGVIDGNIPQPGNEAEVKNIQNKVIDITSNTFDVTIPVGSTKTVLLAIPAINKPANDISIVVIKDGSLPITNSFTKSIVSVSSTDGTGLYKDYVVFRHDNGIGYSKEAIYNITIND